jgi:two-component system, NarL family, response regulator YdfI
VGFQPMMRNQGESIHSITEASIFISATSAARRTGLQKLLSSIWPESAISAGAALSSERMRESGAEILLADIDSTSQAEAFLRFLSTASPLAAVALVDDPDPVWTRRAIAAGVNAILAADASKDDLRLALEAANSGFVLLHPTSARLLFNPENISLPFEEDYRSVEQLTAREREVLNLMSEGLGNREIALRLGISEHTAKFHASSILGKLGASSRTEAVSQGIRRGLISL